MSAVKKFGKDGVVMTLKEITDLIGTRHDKAIKKIEKLSQEPSFGGVSILDIPTFNPDGSVNKYIETLVLNKKQAIAAAARLDNSMLMKVVDRLEELEEERVSVKVLGKIPTYPEALRQLAYSIEKTDNLQLENMKMSERVITLYHSEVSYSATQIAKDLGLSSASLFNQIMVDADVIFKTGKSYALKSSYTGKRFTEIKETEPDKEGKTYTSMKWTPKGKTWIFKNWNKALERMKPDTEKAYRKQVRDKDASIPKKKV